MRTTFARILRTAAVSAAVLLSSRSLALGPHEVVVVANDDSVESVILAKTFMRLRAVPDCNLVRVRVPRGTDGVFPESMTRAEFKTRVFDPLMNGIDRAGIAQHALAVVYSCDFPARIVPAATTNNVGGSTDVSITGATFVRCAWPNDKDIEYGLSVSPLFDAPSPASPDAVPGETQSFDYKRNLFLDGMPLPAMMLAWTGAFGSTLQQSVAALEKSAASDCTSPKGTFWFAVNDDVRSTCRAWEYAGAMAAIEAHDDFRAVSSTNAVPSSAVGDILGYMIGQRTIPDVTGIVPGVAYCDNLTSFGASFWTTHQHKCTMWMKRGAAFSSGTVTEPYAVWEKFPSAWIFPRLLDGATAIEAFYSSVRCPLQILPIGDPLSKPWASLVEPVLTGPDADHVGGNIELNASVPGMSGDSYVRFTWLVDGRPAGNGRRLSLDTRKYSDGPHRIRVVARLQRDNVRCQGFAETVYFVEN